MTNEISLGFLFKVLKTAWWKILIITLIVMLLVAAYTEFFIAKQYASSTEFYILNASVSTEYITSSLTAAVEYLANDYVEIILGDKMIEQVISDLAERDITNYTAKEIRKMISTKTSEVSSVFTVTVTSTNRNAAYYISESIKEIAPKIIREVSRPSYTSNMYRKETTKDANGNLVDIYLPITQSDLECVSVIRSPELARSPVGPSLVKNTLIGGILSACVAYVIFLICKLFDTTIRDEENAKELIGQPIIGSIPTWNVDNQETETQKKESEVK